MRSPWMAGAVPHKRGWCRNKSRSDNHTKKSGFAISVLNKYMVLVIGMVMLLLAYMHSRGWGLGIKSMTLTTRPPEVQ